MTNDQILQLRVFIQDYAQRVIEQERAERRTRDALLRIEEVFENAEKC